MTSTILSLSALAGGKTDVHHCRSDNLTEVQLSNCDSGCKIMACPDCDAEYVAHSAAYGCQRAREDYFRPIEGPTLATVHRRWLDLGLPAGTWAQHAKQVTR